MAKSTMQLLLEDGKLQVGDVLEIDRSRFRDSSKVPNSRVQSYEHDSTFWRCQVTKRTTETEEVKYLKTDRYYRPTTLVNRIAEELTDEDYTPNEIGYWLHPRYDDINLWELRNRV